VHPPTKNKSNKRKDSFYEELEHVFNQFLKYCIKILSGNFNEKAGREDIFKLAIRNVEFT
jgi:hypothetical protein